MPVFGFAEADFHSISSYLKTRSRYSGARLAERLTALYLSLAVASGQPSS